MTGTVRWRMRPAVRKTALLVHIASAGAWLGIDVVLGILVAAAALGDTDETSAAALVAIAEFATWPLVAVGVLTLASGVVLGFGSRYGLVRYWWVAVKLVLNLVLLALVIGLLSPEVSSLGAAARSTLLQGKALPELGDLAFPPIVSTTAVLVAMALSVFKPWGRTPRRSRRTPGERRGSVDQPAGDSS